MESESGRDSEERGRKSARCDLLLLIVTDTLF